MVKLMLFVAMFFSFKCSSVDKGSMDGVANYIVSKKETTLNKNDYFLVLKNIDNGKGVIQRIIVDESHMDMGAVTITLTVFSSKKNKQYSFVKKDVGELVEFYGKSNAKEIPIVCNTSDIDGVDKRVIYSFSFEEGQFKESLSEFEICQKNKID